MKRTLMAAASTAALAAVGLALSASVTPAQAGKDTDTLNIAWDRTLESLDFYFNTAREGIIVQRHVWDNLIYRDPETFDYAPNLATSWTWVDDTTLELEIREGVTFHNGEAFGPDDVVFTLNWISDPDNGVKNQANVAWIAKAEQVGDNTVRITTNGPFPAAIEVLAGPMPMYPREYYSEVGPDGMATAPIGTGPYRVTEVEPGQRIVFEKNENFWEGSPKGTPQIGTIVQRTIPERNTQIAELLGGTLDWIWRVPADQAERLEGRPGIEVVNARTMRIGYLSMDAAGRTNPDGPMTDARVRQAISHAIDRQAIIDALVKGDSELVHSACYPSQVGCETDVVTYDYDPEKARALLAEAGYEDGFTVDFYAYRERDYAEAMMGFLNEVGIDTNFNFLKYAATRDAIRAGEVEMAFMTWGSNSVNDVSAITSVFFTGSGDDPARDPEVMAWLQEGDTTVDPEARNAAYSNALKRIAEQAYWLPLFNYNTNYAFTDTLAFDPDADEVPRFYKASWE